jgi:hypothetical protein
MPIISPMIDNTLSAGIPQLAHELSMDPKLDNKFPRLFVVYGKEGTIVEYPKSLDDEFDINGLLIALWARRTIIYQEIKAVRQAIAELNESVDEYSTEDALDYATLHSRLKEELATVKKRYDEATQELADAKLARLQAKGEEMYSEYAHQKVIDEAMKEREANAEQVVDL